MPLPYSLFARLGFLCLLLLAAPVQSREATPLEFHVTFDKSVSDKPFTGRVYVMLSSKNNEPMRGPNWFNPEPFFALDVKNWKPGTVAIVSASALACPQPLPQLKKGKYHVQALIDFNQGDRRFNFAPGNGYSKAKQLDLDAANSGPVFLTIDQVVPKREFKESERVKLVEIPSKLLSSFQGKPTMMRAAVVLPESFKTQPTRHYPILYEIPGFGGNHEAAANIHKQRNPTRLDGVDFLYVLLDPNCSLGHHVFADSANNGPWGKALTEELIPHIEKEYRALGKPEARLVAGHSSGGWSSLWLQITYPDFFGGCWSTAPDPVDFRDFQRINLYQRGTNFFTDEKGQPRPIARRQGKVLTHFKPFSDMEVVMGHGGQLESFEAVFSPRGKDGKPRKLWDRKTGAIDLEVARAWEAYDIRLILERNWKILGPKLRGKIHVYMGDQDTFYLDGATRLLRDSLKRLESDAVVELFPDRDHGSLMDKKMFERVYKEMASTARQAQARRN